MIIETTIRGYRMRHLATWQTPNALIDSWENRDHPEGSGYRTAAVVTFRVGKDSVDVETGEFDAHIPEGVWATAYDDHPSDNVVDRFQDADRQERARTEARLGGPLHVQQVCPPVED